MDITNDLVDRLNNYENTEHHDRDIPHIFSNVELTSSLYKIIESIYKSLPIDKKFIIRDVNYKKTITYLHRIRNGNYVFDLHLYDNWDHEHTRIPINNFKQQCEEHNIAINNAPYIYLINIFPVLFTTFICEWETVINFVVKGKYSIEQKLDIEREMLNIILSVYSEGNAMPWNCDFCKSLIPLHEKYDIKYNIESIYCKKCNYKQCSYNLLRSFDIIYKYMQYIVLFYPTTNDNGYE
jgi:hypothetical protein